MKHPLPLALLFSASLLWPAAAQDSAQGPRGAGRAAVGAADSKWEDRRVEGCAVISAALGDCPPTN